MNRAVYVGAGLPFLLALIALVDSARVAADAPRTAVAVDWSGVTDTAIRRCDLRGLENLLVQYLVEEGYAVVDQVGPRGLTVRMRSSSDAFEVHVASVTSAAGRRVPIPDPCEASIQLDLIRTTLELAAPIRDALQASALPPEEGVQTEAPREDERPRVHRSGPSRTTETTPRRERWQLGLGAAFSGTLHPLALLRFGVGFPLATRLSLIVSLEAAGTVADRLVLLEPALAAALDWQAARFDRLALVIGLEAAALAHIFIDTGDGAGGHPDGRIGVPVGFQLGDRDLEIAVVPHLRLGRARHDLDGQAVYDAEHWGIALRVEIGL